MKKKTGLITAAGTALLAASIMTGCSDNEEEAGTEAEDTTPEEQEEDSEEEDEPEEEEENPDDDSEEDNPEEDDSEREEVSFDTPEAPGDAPDDQGEMEIRIEAEIEEKEDEIVVRADTNLLPGSRVKAQLWSEDYSIGGGYQFTEVEQDGTAEFSLRNPELYDTVLEVEVEFNPSNQREEDVIAHYGEFGETLEGVYIYRDDNRGADENYVARASAFFAPEEGTFATVETETPEWNFPDDQGELNVRMDGISIEKDDRYFYITGETNLLEGASLEVMVHLPDYIAVGFQNTERVNPDGSFEVRVHYPDEVDEDAAMELKVKFAPYYSSQRDWVTEHYGEEGENLDGDLVIEEIRGNAAELVLELQ
ncbi:hypothetical protein CR205_17515 [Alteribacter lacisalsi]|uniref:Uncharacterized protein n=1 Tax=Alteribacter lacisalsi TaxID=2045244 RepID=A0A2W0HGY0_9BACI|nr:hypothetical protein [Alteribacter lacisalsi]PYZ96162.1 hypothetical protein CR205_17515 [Alteribacter lacisalsi]